MFSNSLDKDESASAHAGAALKLPHQKTFFFKDFPRHGFRAFTILQPSRVLRVDQLTLQEYQNSIQVLKEKFHMIKVKREFRIKKLFID